MSNEKKELDRGAWAVGGGLMLGMGVGFFFFPQSMFGQPSVFAFIGCMLGGLGIGLLIAALLPKSD